jgi:hypothetical protein
MKLVGERVRSNYIGITAYIRGIDIDASLYIDVFLSHLTRTKYSIVPALVWTSDLRMLQGNSAIAINSDICLARQMSCNYGTTMMAAHLYNQFGTAEVLRQSWYGKLRNLRCGEDSAQRVVHALR